jgi:hypothetical protein
MDYPNRKIPMNLSSRPALGVFPPSTEYMLVMSRDEYEKVLAGKPVTHFTAGASFSGSWTVKFKKNSKKKHEALYGL